MYLIRILAMQVDLLKEKLGFDDAFNYKEETDLKSALKRSLFFIPIINIYIIHPKYFLIIN